MQEHTLIEQDLKAIDGLLVEMFDLVDEQLADAANAIYGCDTALARRVQARDDAVDALELKVDRACERYLARHQPTDAPLRKVLAALKTNADLERIGDYSKNLAKYVVRLEALPALPARTRIIDLADVVRAILREAREAFVRQDRLLARKVLAHDLQVDRQHQAAVDAVVALCTEQPGHAAALVYLVTMSRALERIADHAKNIAQRVVYVVEGVDIRHRRLPRPEY